MTASNEHDAPLPDDVRRLVAEVRRLRALIKDTPIGEIDGVPVYIAPPDKKWPEGNITFKRPEEAWWNGKQTFRVGQRVRVRAGFEREYYRKRVQDAPPIAATDGDTITILDVHDDYAFFSGGRIPLRWLEAAED